jgi:ElaB/YqjD/DUF883 family membrane-anchored ribosome-binding protein
MAGAWRGRRNGEETVVADDRKDTEERGGIREALNELQSRLDAALDELRPRIRSAFEDLDNRVDAAVAELKPKAQSAMKEVRPRVDALVADIQPRLDSMLQRLQIRIDEFRRELDERAARSSTTRPPAGELGPGDKGTDKDGDSGDGSDASPI